MGDKHPITQSGHGRFAHLEKEKKKMASKIFRWNSERGFGFIRTNGQDAFLHVTAIEPRQGRGVDLNNREVEVHQISQGDKGPKVTSATLVPTAEEQAAIEAEAKRLAQEKADLEAAKAAEEALRRELGPATILVPRSPAWCYKGDVRIDDQEVNEGIAQGDFIKFSLPSRARMRSAAEGMFKLSPGQVYVLMHISYNARSGVYVDRTEGLEQIFDYGDGHGMRWGGLFKVVSDTWVIDFSIPGHHDHGRSHHRIAGDKTSFENKDGDLVREKAQPV